MSNVNDKGFQPLCNDTTEAEAKETIKKLFKLGAFETPLTGLPLILPVTVV